MKKRCIRTAVAAVAFLLGGPSMGAAQMNQQAQPETQAQTEPSQMNRALTERTIQGTVQSVDPSGKIELQVRDRSVTVEGTQRQVQGYREGDVVQATIVPLAEAESMKKLEDASMQEQLAANEPFNDVIVGRVLDVQQDVALLEVAGEGRQRVQLPEGAGAELVLRQNYVIKLKQPTAEAGSFQLRDIQKQ